MNKCLLCTFFKMIWKGMWDNTCPSIDKTKEEKRVKFGIKDFLVILGCILFSFGIVFLLNELVKFLVWFFGEKIMGMFVLTLMVVALIRGIIGMGIIFFEFIKARIICIKAYWRKAKEACE